MVRLAPAIALCLACHPAPDASRSPEPVPNTAANLSPFVQAEDGRFSLAGQDHVVIGTNFWAGMNLGSAGPGGDRQRLGRELDRLAGLGINNIRVMAASEGPNDAPYRMTPTLMTAPGEYDEAVFAGLDYLLVAAAKRDIKVVMVLTNFWEWSGGMAQYVAWAEGTPIPYPAEHVWTDFTAYASRFYECEACQAAFRAHIETVVRRTNSISGVAYRDDPTIFAWELANEPRLYPAAWIDETAAFIDGLDSQHMITTGSEGEVGGPFAPTHDGEYIDYACAHLWPQNWAWYDPQTPASLEGGLVEALAYVEKHVAASEALGKPLVLEEFGLARDFEPLHDPYDPNSPTTLRDRFYAAIFDAVVASVQTDRPLRGFNFWAWGGEARPPGPWLGDPPHEKPGWYSVYDQDQSTLNLIASTAKALAR